MGWFGTIEYNGNKREFRNAAELSLRMIEFYQKWYIDNFRRRPDEREIKDFFTYRNGIKSIGLIDTADYYRIFSGDRSNWYPDEFIRINGSAYYVQQWEVGDLAALEIKMRDNLGCKITRYCDISNRTNYAYQDTKYNDARRDVIRGNGYRLPAYPIQMPELIVFYKTTIRKEDRVLWLENDIQRDLLDILEFSMRLFSREEYISVPAVILSDEYKVTRIERNRDNPLLILRERFRRNNDIEEGDRDRRDQPPFIDMPIWGEYCAEKNLITIYYKTIMNGCGSESEFRSSVRFMLAHEFFHAFRNLTMPQIRGWNNRLYEAERVNEALCEFFALLWGINKDAAMRRVLKKRFEAWKRLIDYDWPYSYALFFFVVGAIQFYDRYSDYEAIGGIDKFKRIHGECDVNRAFDELRSI